MSPQVGLGPMQNVGIKNILLVLFPTLSKPSLAPPLLLMAFLDDRTNGRAIGTVLRPCHRRRL